ncbi:MAG: DUF4861 family protein [Alistipes sp.]|nr:DUF4861 family protein [Candidatus Alistipes equi]
MKIRTILCVALLVLLVIDAQVFAQKRVMARFVPERHDDFVFENNLVAGRIYGKSLENCGKGSITSPGIDIWVKTPGGLVANERYRMELQEGRSYHKNWGNGKDCYKVSKSLGGGASVPLVNGRPAYPSTNYRSWKILEQKDDKVVFTLSYPQWQFEGVNISLTKKFTVRADTYFVEVEDSYEFDGDSLLVVAGINRHLKQKTIEKEYSTSDSYAIWEKASDTSIEPEDGMIGVAVVVPGATYLSTEGASGMVGKKIGRGETFRYHFGSCWSKGNLKSADDWFTCVKNIFQCPIAFSSEQLRFKVRETWGTDKPLYTRTIKEDGSLKPTKLTDWTVGFFPGSLWYMYEFTNEQYWADAAKHFTEGLESNQFFTGNHDIGFMMYCSYGNAYRITRNEQYRSIIIQSAKSLCTRFRPEAKIIQSWRPNKKKGWICPVIIDNMMNLELLFEASILSGDNTYRDVAITHANTTMKNHFRKDNSSFHVVDYDPQTGAIRSKCTRQGYSDESAWSRGQAWGMYGYTVCYRYTKDKKYLKQAEKIAKFILSHKNLPEDMIPYWDFDAPDIPNAKRDASAGAISASALLELYTYTKNKNYLKAADKMIESLSSDAYRMPLGKGRGFLIQHSVTDLNGGNEVDLPLNYADYYWLEAIKRRLQIK